MLHRQTREDEYIWQALADASSLSATMRLTGTTDEIQRVDRVLRREYRKMIRWRYPLIAFLSIILLLIYVFTLGFLGGDVIFWLAYTSPMMFLVYMIFMQPSLRWKNGVRALIDLSKYAPAEEAISAFLFVASRDYYRLHLNRNPYAAEFYHQLAQILTRQTGFVPDMKERQFLQRVVFDSRRYSDPLRIATLLTLGDHPEQLPPKFWARLGALSTTKQSEAFLAAARDVMSRH